MLMQGMLNRQQIDPRFFKCRLCRLGYNTSRRVGHWLTMTNTGRTFTLPNCELRRCRHAAYDDTTRRAFADQFGAAFARHYDAVACNFPTWQCALFMYVNVSILMRFTHRCARCSGCASVSTSRPLGGCVPNAYSTLASAVPHC